MKLSTKGRYGLRALVDLAQNSQNEAASTGSIAQRQGISERYLEQLMAKLKRAGIITGIRGAQGGYVLARRAEDITIGDVLRSLEGDLNAVDCPAAMDSGECNGSEQCAAKLVWKKINDVINQTVNSIRLSDLLQQQETVPPAPGRHDAKTNHEGIKAYGQNDLFRQCCNHGNKA
jgi:Rrf2 family protein